MGHLCQVSQPSMAEGVVRLGILKPGKGGFEFQLHLLPANYLFLLNLSFFIFKMKIMFSLVVVRKLNDLLYVKHIARLTGGTLDKGV